MSKTKSIDISWVKFTSTVFPTDEDMKLWESLTPEQRKAVELRDIEEGRASGLAEPCTMAEIIAEAKAEMNGGWPTGLPGTQNLISKPFTVYTVEYFGEGQAQEYLDGLYYSFDLLTDNPNLGRSFEGNMRRYVFKSHLVYYEVKKDVIHILRIRSGRQNS